MKDEIKLSALITCPACGFAQPVEMPVDIWVQVYVCPRCGAASRKQPGDCCVYCSYSDTLCPSRQEELGQGSTQPE